MKPIWNLLRVPNEILPIWTIWFNLRRIISHYPTCITSRATIYRIQRICFNSPMCMDREYVNHGEFVSVHNLVLISSRGQICLMRFAYNFPYFISLLFISSWLFIDFPQQLTKIPFHTEYFFHFTQIRWFVQGYDIIQCSNGRVHNSFECKRTITEITEWYRFDNLNFTTINDLCLISMKISLKLIPWPL